MNLILQNIIEEISIDSLPIQWQEFELSKFSSSKTLFEFQQKALENSLKALWLFYEKLNGSKKDLFANYQLNGLDENFDFDLANREGKKTAQYLLEYDKEYPVIDNKIAFEHFVNRMSFWMATGSGKTLVIVKLIEILGQLIKENKIPNRDILFLAHREDLIEQFKNHVDEYNSFNFSSRINLKSLKEFDQVKRESSLFANNEITVFYYKSDLFSDETKEKQINFRNYDNKGNWFILLDEAHKGDREESIRQVIFSILSRNGFLFNFSATFTDPRDYSTCVFNFNLSKYVEEGYGKHIYVSQSDISAFGNRNGDEQSISKDFSDIDKQKIVLKSLILLTAIHKSLKQIRKTDPSLYHLPLLLTLVNSVNTEDSDLQLFFIELEKIASGKIQNSLFDNSKNELINEFAGDHKYLFEEELNAELNRNLIENISFVDISEQIFHSKSSGKIEVIKVPGNRSELIFKLTTADSPFALIKIGDISNWIKEKLSAYEINESFDNESYFKGINNDDSAINILMGSRTFYEGWDSNRPNIVLFINIGVGKDAKKFVLQSVGRGVRIEPLPDKRKRLKNIFNSGAAEKETFNKISNKILPIESLYIFGTNSKNLNEVITTLRGEKDEIEIGDLFEVNESVSGKLLLIPEYNNTEKLYVKDNLISKYQIGEADFKITKQYFNYIKEKITITKYEMDVESLKLISDAIIEPEKYFLINHNSDYYLPELQLNRLSKYFSIRSEELEKFKELDNEIVHFKKIKANSSKHIYETRQKIEAVKNYKEKNRVLEQLKIKFNEHKDLDKYTRDIQKIENEYKKEDELNFNGKKLKIKYAQHHYYIPIIISESEKIDYISHIIKVPSEVRFLEALEKYLQKENNLFAKFDWWLFSKIDETLDEIFIPYFNPKINLIAKYKPDFIFWLQKGNEYKIVFVDPKGVEFSSYQHKVDGFKRIFEDKIITQGNLKINVLLKLYTSDVASVSEDYRKYWFDEVGGLFY